MRGRSLGVLARILLILVAIMATEFIANTLVFNRANRFALREDDAHRMAEHLVVARRVLDRTRPSDRPFVANELSTDRFTFRWSRAGDVMPSNLSLRNMRNQILEQEPALLEAKLRIHLLPLPKGGDVAGTMELSDGTLLFFRTYQAKAIWTLTFGRILSLIAPTLVLVLVGIIMIRATLGPLRVLMRATRQVGTQDPKPVPEAGPAEVRSLIHGFNAMQDRIHRLITSRTQALAAVGHDLRTPLARLQLRLDGAGLDPATQRPMDQDIEEMTGLLHSLQIYLSGEEATVTAESVDLAIMAATQIDAARDAGKDAHYFGPDHLVAHVRPVAIRRALTNLIDNALHYGGNVRLTLRERDDGILIIVDDDGPGIAEDKLAEVLQPFVRLDGARSRNTRGMGLGLAIVNDAVRAEKGSFTIENRPEGGLRATIRLPRAAG
ncbi:ATP-binding protein [Flavisphingomonas formosensis]|uniref:ATP-binding protein n=1 Tax=Flavisphingomonas formosensis TaxID=861534 RepID=UPI0012FBE721|nr:ATP-binding protein [Sphingomonas formosensis]